MKSMMIGMLSVVTFVGITYAKALTEYSVFDLRQIREWAQTSLDAYSGNGGVTSGYQASGNFLNSSAISHRIDFSDASGNYSYTVFEMPYTDSTGNQQSGLYKYNPANGQITPWESEYVQQYKQLIGGQTPWVEAVVPSPPDFVAQVLQKDGQSYVVFAGTDSAKDWGENFDQWNGKIPPQFQIADFLTQCVQDVSNGTITLEGHSEGGGEVQYSILKSLERGNGSVVGVTFNSQRLSKDVLDQFDQTQIDAAIARIYNFVMGNDAVSGWGILGEDLLGDVTELGRYCTVGNDQGICLYAGYGIYRAHALEVIVDKIDELLSERQTGSDSGTSGDGGNESPFDSDPDTDGSSTGSSGAKQSNEPVGLTPFKTY